MRQREQEGAVTHRTDGLAGALEAIEETVVAVDAEVDALREVARRTGWLRAEHVILGVLGVLFAGYVFAYFVLDLDLDSLRRWGYLGIFLIALAGAATIVLPTPSTVAIFSGGVVLEPVLGIPAPLLVGLVAGLGDALGELSGYALGYAGTDAIKSRRIYATFERWMARNGTVTIFLLCTFPNPFFDLAGAIAGASRMSPLRFFLATLGGKIVKDLFLAYGGSFSIGVLSDLL
jgi:uncharacterized membrane protein YdjX (TVP38/TMEM64 family)